MQGRPAKLFLLAIVGKGIPDAYARADNETRPADNLRGPKNPVL